MASLLRRNIQDFVQEVFSRPNGSGYPFSVPAPTRHLGLADTRDTVTTTIVLSVLVYEVMQVFYHQQ